MSNWVDRNDNDAMNTDDARTSSEKTNLKNHDSMDIDQTGLTGAGETSSEKYSEEDDGNTASTVYTPTATSAFIYSEKGKKPKGKAQKMPTRTGIAMSAILLSLCLILGVVGGASGMMFTLLKYAEHEGGSGSDTENAVTGAEESSGTTIYKQSATVNVVELPAAGQLLSVAQVNAKVADAVVAISTSVQMSSVFYGGFYVTTGAGSGVIVSSDGYIVTNYHVIDDASEIKVTLNNGNVYPAVYLDGDKLMDIALLKIEPTETLLPVEIGSSTALVVGQEVVAVGNPLGTLPGTVTDGIVSALDRTIEIDGYTRTLIQTDAAINPGNSGGGLFDRYGRLVGIVNAKESSEGVEGLGFAIPIDGVFPQIIEIIEDGYIHGRACLDLEMREITDVKEAYSLYRNQNRGIYIQSSRYGSEINIEGGDRIHALNGVEIDSESDLHAILSTLKPGEAVTLQLGRVSIISNGYWSSYTEKLVEVTVTLKEYIPSYAVTFE